MVLIKNGSRSSSIKISIHRLFNGSKLYSKSLQPQKTTDIHIADLKKETKSFDSGVVLLLVKTLKNNLIWKGPVPISSDLIPITINPETKKVFYGKTQLPSIAASSSSQFPIECFLGFVVFIIIVYLSDFFLIF